MLALRGNWRDSVADVVLESTGQVCMHVQRKSTLKSLSAAVFGKQTYRVTVAPGMDLAAAAAMCVVFDEWQNESGDSGYAGVGMYGGYAYGCR